MMGMLYRTLRARHDLAAVGRNVHASDSLVMPGELILKGVLVAPALVYVDNVLTSYSERLAVGGEGMVCDRVMEEVVDFWGSHCIEYLAIGDSLLLRGAEIRYKVERRGSEDDDDGSRWSPCTFHLGTSENSHRSPSFY